MHIERCVRTLCAATAAAAALLAQPAALASTARVALENLKITLVDLDAADGVTPFVLGPGNAAGESFLFHCPGGVCNDWFDARRVGGLPVFDPSGTPWSADIVSSEFSDRYFFTPDAFGAEVVTGTRAAGFNGKLSAGFWTFGGSQGSRFTLSQQTQLLITGNLVAYSDGDASAAATAQLRWDIDTGTWDTLVTSPISAASTGGQGQVSTPFSFSYSNLQEWNVGGELRITLDTQALATPSAVPEPAAGVLAIAGSLLLARRLRRPSGG